jgi:hypothetical protein
MEMRAEIQAGFYVDCSLLLLRYQFFKKMKYLTNFINLQISALLNMTIQIAWDVTTCRLVNRYRRFLGVYCLHLQGLSSHSALIDKFQDGGKTLLRNVAKYVPVDTVYYNTRLVFLSTRF